MPVTVSVYNHTTSKLLGETFATSHTYIANLYSAFTFNAAATTKSAAEVGCTQIATAAGYTQDSKVVPNVTVTQVTTNDAMWDADNILWTASEGDITASWAMIYNDSVTDDPPVFAINFGQSVTVYDTFEFKINWNANGIFRFNIT